MRGLLCTLAFALAAAPAFSQEPEPSAASGSLALELIAAARADGVFVAEASEPHTIVIRHPSSGLICRMGAEDANRLIIFPQAARGEDVACETEHDNVSIRLFATRYSFDTSLDEQLRGASAVIERLHPGARPFTVALPVADQSLPPHRSVAYVIESGGASSFTSVSVAKIGEWVFKLRYTASAADAEAARAAAAAAERTFAETLHQIVARGGASQ
ncbi:MAG: hypothetical protein AB7T59_12215 [Hyphomonadaceae bacterium]